MVSEQVKNQKQQRERSLVSGNYPSPDILASPGNMSTWAQDFTASDLPIYIHTVQTVHSVHSESGRTGSEFGTTYRPSRTVCIQYTAARLKKLAIAIRECVLYFFA